MLNDIRQWLREHYAPAWRYQTILIDAIILAGLFGFVFPALFIVWRIIWRTALGC